MTPQPTKHSAGRSPGSAPVPLHLHRPAQRDELRTPHHLRRLQHGQGFRSGGTDGPQRKGGTGKIIKKGENQHERVPASPARHPLMSAISSVHETLANDIFQ